MPLRSQSRDYQGGGHRGSASHHSIDGLREMLIIYTHFLDGRRVKWSPLAERAARGASKLGCAYRLIDGWYCPCEVDGANQ